MSRPIRLGPAMGEMEEQIKMKISFLWRRKNPKNKTVFIFLREAAQRLEATNLYFLMCLFSLIFNFHLSYWSNLL